MSFLERSWPLASLLGCVLAAGGASAATPRPSLVNTRIATPFGANGHASSLDGRLFIGNVGEDHATTTTTWRARVFKPEAVTYDAEGKPGFGAAFSSGRTLQVKNGENALAFCFPNPAQPYTLASGEAVYQPYLFDSKMFSGPNRFRRRTMEARISQPFTTQAEVAAFSTGPLETLTTVTGAEIFGIEPTMTSDGRLLLFQGGPNNVANDIDRIMYSYNPTPCAASGWSTPRPLSMMYNDTTSGVKRYPLAWQRLKAATGEFFGDTLTGDLVRGAYPWVDHEGRNVLFMAVGFSGAAGGRREAVSLVGADTGWTAHHLDGSINTDRQDVAHLFYSGPMWNFEQERSPRQNFPPGSSNETRYLPVTKTHDVLSLFGSNTADYNEVDLGELSHPFQVLTLPMNEMVTRAGTYDLTRTPDTSGRFYTGTLVGTASISPGNALTQPTTGSLWEPHGKGKALTLPGGGALNVALTDASGSVPGVGAAVRGFSVQLAIRPDASINQGCAGNPYRYLLARPGALDLIYEANGAVNMSFVINGNRVRLGFSQPLPKGKWTHLAYTWDGVSGEFGEYINGVKTSRALPTAPGSFKLGTGSLFIGAGSNVDTQACPANGEGSFQGAIDEVRFFSQARSNRSICLTTLGADCKDAAIQEEPTGLQFVMNQQHPDCNGIAALGTEACAVSMHRVCAQRGADDALASATNFYETLRQVVGNRPPISLLGVPASATATEVNVACAPIQHESLAVTYEELTRRHAECTDERASQSTACSAAIHRWCNSLGWTTGQLFEMTSRPWVGCFNSALVQDVSRQQLGSASVANITSGASRLEVSAWCRARGYGAGVVQELGSGSVAQVHCFQPAVTRSWKFTP